MTRPTSKPVIGLCGMIGAGKSTVAGILAELGCLVIDSDALNREVLATPEVARTLREWWGPGVINADGTPERRALAGIVFNDPARRKRLESLTHPLIAARRRDIILRRSSDPALAAIVLDSPLLLESRLDRLCDAVILIDATLEQRQKRVASRGWNQDELSRRELWQAPHAEKRSRADFVIDNNGTLAQLRARTRAVLDRVLAQTSNR